MENRRNYYRILQVQPGAPVEIIRASYRTLMQRLKAHPDLGGEHGHAALINEAYAVLTSPRKRAAYDQDFQLRVIDTRTEAARDAPAARRGARGHQAEHCLFCGAPHQSRPVQQPDARCRHCASPLHPATARQLASDGRRALPRLPGNHELRLFTRWPGPAITGHSRDVSPDGIGFETRRLLEPGTVVKVDSDWCQAVARITHIRLDDGSSDGSWLVGAGFLSVVFPRSRGVFLSTQA
ncbi:MAG: J domain-containing protein [Gammaproteobacteria bacterium]|nr:J domain-containing protein [Gammaproteobacteria bacterium]QOJ32753.1 MAG: J domain-containing protein [Gammaproteobacteria bacterium]